MKETTTLTRDCEATVVPFGDRVVLTKGQEAHITQSLGGTFTVVVGGNMYRVDGRDADALGQDSTPSPALAQPPGTPLAREEVEKRVWEAMRTCYDPEIPVNIVDLGLIYDCHVSPLDGGGRYKVEVKMTLTAPGCGMGPVICQDVENKLRAIESVEEVTVELVWDPPWNQAMMAEAARLQLGLM